MVHDEPEYDTYSDDEPDFPEPAEEAAIHTETADVPADTVESDTVDSGSDDAAAEEEADSESGPAWSPLMRSPEPRRGQNFRE